MRTSFHHQPEAQHPIFQLSTSWQADYPHLSGVKQTGLPDYAMSAVDPKRTKTGLKSRSAAGSAPTFPSATASSGLSRWSARAHNRETGR
jgi:hypothetical protein